MGVGKGMHRNMSKFDFVFWHVLVAIWSWCLYLKFFDGAYVIAGFSPLTSHMILMGLIVGCNILGTVFRMKSYRRWTTVCMDCFMPFGIFVMLVNWSSGKTAFSVSLLTAGMLALFYLLLVFGRRIRNKMKIKKILLRRAHRGLVGCYHVFCTLFVMFAVCGAIGGIHSKRSIQATVEATQQNLLIENAEALKVELLKLSENVWQELTLQERINLLQVIANLEQQYLGIPQRLEVRIKRLDCGVLGAYNDFTWRIYVDRTLVEEGKPWQVLETVFHEAYHAYEHRMVDVYENLDKEDRALQVFREVGEYAQEFEEYIDSGNDEIGYYMQKCEEDARDYSDRRVLEYYRALAEWEEEMNETR